MNTFLSRLSRVNAWICLQFMFFFMSEKSWTCFIKLVINRKRRDIWKYYEYKGNHIKNCKKQSTITSGSSIKWNPHRDASVESPQRIK